MIIIMLISLIAYSYTLHEMIASFDQIEVILKEVPFITSRLRDITMMMKTTCGSLIDFGHA